MKYISFGRLGQLHAGTVMVCISLAYVAAWTALPLTFFNNPFFDWDTTVELMWGQEWFILPPWHPPLPNWLLYIFFRLGGSFSISLMSPLSQAFCFFIVYLFARRFVEPSKALLSAALLLGTHFFYTADLLIYNHNTAQPIFWILVIYLFHSCLHGRGLHYWVFLGAAAAACFLVKYTAVFLLICVPAWLLLYPSARKLLWTSGPWISLSIFLALIAPHVIYFILYDGIIPGLKRPQQGVLDMLLFSIRGHFWMLLVLALAGFLWKGAFSWRWPLSHDDRFLLVFGLAPFCLVFVVGTLLDQGYSYSWFWPFSILSGLLAMRFWGSRATVKRCQWAVYGCIALLIIMPGFALAKISLTGEVRKNGKGPFILLSDLARKMDEIYAEHSIHSRKIVVVPYDRQHSIAGVAFMMDSPQPRTLFEARSDRNPAIDRKDLCDATIILSYRGKLLEKLKIQRRKRLMAKYLHSIEGIISDCVAQGVVPITVDVVVGYKPTLWLIDGYPPPFDVSITLLAKERPEGRVGKSTK